jgi:hypothetical protein
VIDESFDYKDDEENHTSEASVFGIRINHYNTVKHYLDFSTNKGILKQKTSFTSSVGNIT